MVRIRKESDYISIFDDHTGAYVRSGIMEEGKDSGCDPFMSTFPELLDVGIMGHCTHGKTGLCLRAGVQCYQSGLTADTPNMKLDSFWRIARECKDRTFQFALGGCGDPDQHDDFVSILEICRECHIVPNFTTSGFGLTEEKAKLCSMYCGAVAVSWYRSSYTTEAIYRLLAAGVKTNIHYVLTRYSIGEAIERIQEKSFPLGVNAVVFLLHKPIGLGTKEYVVDSSQKEIWELFRLISDSTLPWKVGFDSCSAPGLIRAGKEAFDLRSLDYCEGARWSAYITPDLYMLPCSFDNQSRRWAVNLCDYTIEEAWNSSEFVDFRKHFENACPDCEDRKLCMGGCPICPEIVLCDRFQRQEHRGLFL